MDVDRVRQVIGGIGRRWLMQLITSDNLALFQDPGPRVYTAGRNVDGRKAHARQYPRRKRMRHYFSGPEDNLGLERDGNLEPPENKFGLSRLPMSIMGHKTANRRPASS